MNVAYICCTDTLDGFTVKKYVTYGGGGLYSYMSITFICRTDTREGFAAIKKICGLYLFSCSQLYNCCYKLSFSLASLGLKEWLG